MEEAIVAWAFRVMAKGRDDVVWCRYFPNYETAKKEFEKAVALTKDEHVTSEGLSARKIQRVNIAPGETKVVYDGG